LTILTIAKNCALSTAIAILTAGILLLIFAVIAYSNHDPDRLAFPLSLAALYIGALAGGIIASRRTKARTLFCGAISGLMYLFVIFTISLAVSGGNDVRTAIDGVNSVIAHAAVAAVSIAGAVIGADRKRGNSAKKHKIPKGYKINLYIISRGKIKNETCKNT
jgi:putative membrane protein, TIGR04086 family/integral membrane protein, TIGR04097 family